MNNIQKIIQEAQKIKEYADSEFCSERELTTMSEKFYVIFGRRWVELV